MTHNESVQVVPTAHSSRRKRNSGKAQDIRMDFYVEFHMNIYVNIYIEILAPILSVTL